LFQAALQGVSRKIGNKTIQDVDALKDFKKFCNLKSNLWKTYVDGAWNSSWADYLIDSLEPILKVNIVVYILEDHKLKTIRANPKSTKQTVCLIKWLDHYDLLINHKV